MFSSLTLGCVRGVCTRPVAVGLWAGFLDCAGVGPLIGVLGPVVVMGPGGYAVVAGRAARVLIARMVVGPAVVSVDELADALWGETVPASVAVTVRSHLSRLRTMLREAAGYDPIAAYPGGYRLTVPAADIDAGRFEAAVAEARALPAIEAAPALREALSLWRGPAFGDLRYEQFAAGEAARLEEVRLIAVAARFEAELRSGRVRDTIAELASLTEQHPLRQDLIGLHMRALHHTGRQRDALAATTGTGPPSSTSPG
jgi:DNA-binding SARP family transcriptional activator